MPTIQIYDKDNNRSYNVTVTLKQTYTNTNASATQEGQGIVEYYLTITTTIPHPDGGSFPTYYIKTLSDVPTGYPVATDFDELVRDYIEYFQEETIYASSSSESSSSSSSVEFSSESSSSSISSVGFSSSSST